VHVVKELLDGRVIQVADCGMKNIDHNKIFTKENYDREFPFPIGVGQLSQYFFSPEEFRLIDHYKEVLGMPPDCKWKGGGHEIKTGGFIEAHTDGDYYGGLTIFLNKEWDIHDGGWGVAYDHLTNEIVTTIPKFDCGVFYHTPLSHGSFPVLKPDAVRRTLQIFFYR
jgi:Rps23 Pro-64 3,4-dihydroxylase Tpa1-like proline 4-hydroxylase